MTLKAVSLKYSAPSFLFAATNDKINSTYFPKLVITCNTYTVVQNNRVFREVVFYISQIKWAFLSSVEIIGLEIRTSIFGTSDDKVFFFFSVSKSFNLSLLQYCQHMWRQVHLYKPSKMNVKLQFVFLTRLLLSLSVICTQKREWN